MWVLWLSITAAIVLLIVVLSVQTRKKQSSSRRDKSEKKQLVFDVSNMKCGGCVSSVTEALAVLDNTEIVEVSLDDNQATVMSSLPAEKIAEAITASGFPAVVK